MEQLGNVITELIKTGREIAPMALFGYFTYRILEVIIWPLAYLGIGFSVVRVIGLRLVMGWQTWLNSGAEDRSAKAKATVLRAEAEAKSMVVRARTEYIQQLLSTELLIERRQNKDASYRAPDWHAQATSWIGGYTT